MVVGATFSGGEELAVVAGMGCEEAIDGLGVGVRMMRE